MRKPRNRRRASRDFRATRAPRGKSQAVVREAVAEAAVVVVVAVAEAEQAEAGQAEQAGGRPRRDSVR